MKDCSLEELTPPGRFLSWSQSIYPLPSAAALPVTDGNDLFFIAKNFPSWES